MRRVAGLLLTMGGLVIVGGFLAVAALFMSAGMESEDNTTQTATVSMCTIAGETGGAALTSDQQQNATTIVEVGTARGIPPRGLMVAIATALQESGLRNLEGGDRDSAGLFQQRPSAGWGTHAQVTDPVYAAHAFFGGPDYPPGNPGLLDLAGWEQMPVTAAAQAVQRSAFPNAYAKHEAQAAAIVETVTGTAPDACRPLASGQWVPPSRKAPTGSHLRTGRAPTPFAEPCTSTPA